MSEEQAISEIINWCTGLNTNYLNNLVPTLQFPAVCSTIQNNRLIWDHNENPHTESSQSGLVTAVQDIRDLSLEKSPPSTDGAIGDNAVKYCCTIFNTQKKKQDVINAKEDYDIALQRAEATRDPASKVSRYGTNFAFGKPLRFSTIPYLIAISIFFLLLGLAFYMQLGGISISISSSGPSKFAELVSAFKSSWSDSAGSFKIILILISVVVGAAAYYGASKLSEYAKEKKTNE